MILRSSILPCAAVEMNGTSHQQDGELVMHSLLFTSEAIEVSGLKSVAKPSLTIPILGTGERLDLRQTDCQCLSVNVVTVPCDLQTYFWICTFLAIYLIASPPISAPCFTESNGGQSPGI